MGGIFLCMSPLCSQTVTVQDVVFLSPLPFQVEPLPAHCCRGKKAHSEGRGSGLALSSFSGCEPQVSHFISLSLSFHRGKNEDSETLSQMGGLRFQAVIK